MKKKYIQLGAAALALAVMAGALMLLRSQPDEAEPETPAASEAVYIYGGAPAENSAPVQIDIVNESGDVTIDAEPGGDAVIRGWENLSLDSYGLGQAVSNAEAMSAKEIISESATGEELKTFGLDKPRATVRVRLQNGGTHVILFGDSAPGSEGVYVKPQNENKIYLVSDSTALPYFKPATAYVNKTITATDPEFKGFDKITLSGANYPEPIIIERTPEDSVEAAGVMLNTHAIVSPVKRSLDSQRGLEPLTSVYGLLANDVVAVDDSPETLERYGLKDPATVISVAGETPEATFTLRISDPDENGEVHLIKSGSKVIYELSPSALPFLSLTVFDMMDRMVVVPNIKNVSKIILATPAKKYEFAMSVSEDNVIDVSLNGVTVPDSVDESGNSVTGGENFRKLYQTMLVCRYDEPIPESENGEDTLSSKFLGSLEYIYNTGAPSDVVEFYSGPPRKVEIRLNGDGGYYGQSVYLDRLLEDTAKVENGILVKTYI